MPPAKREARCNQSSVQWEEKEQMKRRGVAVRAEEYPSRGSAGFYGEYKHAQRIQQLTEHRQSLGPVHKVFLLGAASTSALQNTGPQK